MIIRKWAGREAKFRNSWTMEIPKAGFFKKGVEGAAGTKSLHNLITGGPEIQIRS